MKINFQGTELRVYTSNRPRYIDEKEDIKDSSIKLREIPVPIYKNHTLENFDRLEFDPSDYDSTVWFLMCYRNKVCDQKFMISTTEYNSILEKCKKFNIQYKIIYQPL